MGEERFAAQLKWIESEEGAAELALLEKHFAALSIRGRKLVSEIAARSGRTQALSLTLLGLLDKECRAGVIESVRYATIFESEPEFRAGIAPEIARWALRDCSAIGRMAIEMLPKLDAGIARQTLLSPDLLNGEPERIIGILGIFNEAGKSLPIEFVEKALTHYGEASARQAFPGDSAYDGWRQAVFALAYHKPVEAVAVIEQRVALQPQWSDNLSGIWLHSSGLMNLYHHLCDWADNPATFGMLPETTRIYFATSYFLCDCENGGIGQALGNSIGDHAHLALAGFDLVGASGWVAFLEQVFALFGADGPSMNRQDRNRQMEAMEPSFWAREEALNAELFGQKVESNEILSARWLLERYAAEQVDELRPFLTKKVPLI